MRTILITGATGFVGRVLTRILVDQGYTVRVALRTTSKIVNDLSLQRCEIFTIDESKPELGLAGAMCNVDMVIHLAARVHVTHETEADPLYAFRQVNTEYTKLLAEQAILAKVKRFIFLSTLNLYVDGSDSYKNLFSESDQISPKTPYAVSKYEAEQYLNQVAKQGDIETVIIRPPLVYGPHVKANFLSLLKLTKTGLPLPVGALNNMRSMISVNNLVNFIVHCIEHPKAANETFLISDDCDISTKELFAKLIKLFGKRPLLLPIPAKLLYTLGALVGKKDIVDRLCAPLQVDITKAKTLLNWQPIQTLDAGLKEAVNWYKQEYV